MNNFLRFALLSPTFGGIFFGILTLGFIPIFSCSTALAQGWDNPVERAEWERNRLVDPATGKIPDGIRAKELEFVKNLPKREQSSVKNSAIQAGTWTQRGMVNKGGRTRAFAIDRANEDILLAGAVSGGMWRSTNKGQSWTKTTDPTQLFSVTSLAQDPRTGKTNIWYYGTGELRANSADLPGNGIFKSTDNGASWQLLASTTTASAVTQDQIFDFVHSIAVDPKSTGEGTVYAAGYGGIARSTDGGATWQSALGKYSSGGGWSDIAISSGGVMYATSNATDTTKGLWRSTDGVQWTKITPASFPTSYQRIVIGIAPSNENIVYFLGNTPGSGVASTSLWRYEYVSGDGSGTGGVWENRSAAIPTSFQNYSNYCMLVAAHPEDEDIVFIGGMDLFRSMDGFASTTAVVKVGGWLYESNYDHHADQHLVAFSRKSPNVMYSTNDGGVSRTDDCIAPKVVWKSLNNAYATTQFYAIAIEPQTAGDNVFIGGMQDNGTWFTNSPDFANPWREIYGGDGAFCAIDKGKESYYVSSQSGQIYRYLLDANGARLSSTKVTPSGLSGFQFVHPFFLDPNDNHVMYLPLGTKIYKNTDLTGIPMGGGSNTSVNWITMTNATVSGTINAIGLSVSSEKIMYYGTSGGAIYKLFNPLQTSTVASQNVSNGKGLPAANINCIAVNPLNSNEVLAVYSNYRVQSLWYSADGGATWTAVGGNLEEKADGTGNGPSCRWASFLKVGSETYCFVGTSAGLFSTKKFNGATTVWAQEGAGIIGNAVIDMVLTRQSDGLVAVGSHGNGAFSATFSSGASPVWEEHSNSVAFDVATFPNPSSESVEIRFYLPENGKTYPASLSLFDALGNQVRNIFSSRLLHGGDYTVSAQVSDLPEGVYMFRVSAGEYVGTGKVLVKK